MLRRLLIGRNLLLYSPNTPLMMGGGGGWYRQASTMTPRAAAKLLGFRTAASMQELLLSSAASRSAAPLGDTHHTTDNGEDGKSTTSSTTAATPASSLIAKRLKRAYLDATLTCHPDLFPYDPEATERFKQLSEAFRVALAFYTSPKLNATSRVGVDDDRDDTSFFFDPAAALLSLQKSANEHYALLKKTKKGNMGMTSLGIAVDDEVDAAVGFDDALGVVRREALTSLRLRRFTRELPEVLCGTEHALFETFAFHPVRCVQVVSPLIMRFSKELPVIVRRVVKRRPQVIRYRKDSVGGVSAMAGFATSTGTSVSLDGQGDPDTLSSSFLLGKNSSASRRIEDMTMKPLVLLGALLFVDSQHASRGLDLELKRSARRSKPSRDSNRFRGAPENEDDKTSSDAPSHRSLGGDTCSSSSSETKEGGGSGGGDSGSDSSTPPPLTGYIAFGRSAVTTGADIFCCAELRCVITDEDTTDSMGTKISQWESHSFDRLRLELDTGNALHMLTSTLHLEANPLSMEHDLSRSFAFAKRVSLTVQRLLCATCAWVDIAREHVAEDGAGNATIIQSLVDEIRDLAEEAATVVKGSIQVTLREPPPLRKSEPACGDGVHDRAGGGYNEEEDGSSWDTLVQAASEVTAPQSDVVAFNAKSTCGTEGDGTTTGSAASDSSSSASSLPLQPVVSRYAGACDAADIAFAVSVPLTKDIMAFLTCLRDGLSKALSLNKASQEVLPELLRLREVLHGDELLPVHPPATTVSTTSEDHSTPMKSADEASPGDHITRHEPTADPLNSKETETTTDFIKGNDEDSHENVFGSLLDDALGIRSGRGDVPCTDTPRFVSRRAPITCISRVFNMQATDELLLWQHLHAHREYLASRQAIIDPWNVFFECPPYDVATAGSRRAPAPSPPTGAGAEGGREDAGPAFEQGGWVNEGHGDGNQVMLTRKELADVSAFHLWLQEVVEQSSLAKECERLLRESGVHYVERDPSLPLTHYMSFLKLFLSEGGSAAREMIERGSSGKSKKDLTPAGGVSISIADAGLVLVIGSACDLREGGRLYIPWHCDISQLVAALQHHDSALLEGKHSA